MDTNHHNDEVDQQSTGRGGGYARDGVSTIPDAAIEAAALAMQQIHHPSSTTITERDRQRATIVLTAAAAEHLTPTPPAEGDVRTGLLRVLAEHGADNAEHVADGHDSHNRCGAPGCDFTDYAFDGTLLEAFTSHQADVVLANGLVVSVGEVEGLRKSRRSALDEAAEAARRRDAAEAERDDALAEVARLRNLLAACPRGMPGHACCDCPPPLDAHAWMAAMPTEFVDTAPAPSRLPARLLNGSHVGRTVRLPDGTELRAESISHDENDGEQMVSIDSESSYNDLDPDDVVELVDPAVDGSDS